MYTLYKENYDVLYALKCNRFYFYHLLNLNTFVYHVISQEIFKDTQHIVKTQSQEQF